MARRATGSAATTGLAELALDRFPDEAARTLETADVEEVVALLARQPAERTARVMRRLTPDRAARRGAEFAAPLRRSGLGALAPGRAAGLVARLDPEQQETALAPL
ncbi:MAG: hypothetical protein ACQGVC_14650, partial [Myxococcota bacterium]